MPVGPSAVLGHARPAVAIFVVEQPHPGATPAVTEKGETCLPPAAVRRYMMAVVRSCKGLLCW